LDSNVAGEKGSRGKEGCKADWWKEGLRKEEGRRRKARVRGAREISGAQRKELEGDVHFIAVEGGNPDPRLKRGVV